MTAPLRFPLPDDYVSRSLIIAAMFSFAGFFVTAPVVLFDERTLNGAIVWWKPLKFWLSLGVQFATFAVLAQLLTERNRSRLALKVMVFIAAAAMVLENVYITIQAARGRASHFNFDTPVESIAYALMGLGALTFVALSVMLGFMLAFQRDGDRSGLKLGAILGLVVSGILTLGFGGFISQHGSHYFNAPGVSDADGLLLTGWNVAAPDLRPAHFVATHILQVAPLVGWIMDAIAPSLARPAVWGATAILALLASALFAATLAGAAPLGFLS